MTVLHTGSTKKFSANWGSIFGGAKPTKAEAKPVKKAAPKAKAAKAKSAKKPKPKK